MSESQNSLREYAVSGKTFELIAVLERHPDWIGCTNEYGWTPLHLASDSGNTAAVEALMARGADGNIQNEGGDTPLHLAADWGHTSTVEVLMARGADGNIQDKHGWTPLHRACYWGHTSTIETLMARGCNGNIQDEDGRTPLHVASVWDSTDVKAIMARRAFKSVKEKSKGVSFNWEAGGVGIPPRTAVEALIARGADGYIQDKDGRTALDLASRDVIVLLNRLLSYQKRRQPFMMFLSSYQFFRPPARFPRETIIEKTIVAEDLHKFLMSFL